jgi:hypothetical protein
MGDAQVGDGAPQSIHFVFGIEDFWIAKSWDLASSTEMSAAIIGTSNENSVIWG